MYRECNVIIPNQHCTSRNSCHLLRRSTRRDAHHNTPCTPDQWINIAGTQLEKGASSWFRAEKASIHAGDRAPWADWREFAQEITATFSAITKEEQTRKQLKGLSQTGFVQNYIQCFRDLKLRIPSMFVADTYTAFMDGLKPTIQ